MTVLDRISHLMISTLLCDEHRYHLRFDPPTWGWFGDHLLKLSSESWFVNDRVLHMIRVEVAVDEVGDMYLGRFPRLILVGTEFHPRWSLLR
jgi:hypothetical protein